MLYSHVFKNKAKSLFGFYVCLLLHLPKTCRYFSRRNRQNEYILTMFLVDQNEMSCCNGVTTCINIPWYSMYAHTVCTVCTLFQKTNNYIIPKYFVQDNALENTVHRARWYGCCSYRKVIFLYITNREMFNIDSKTLFSIKNNKFV